MVNLIMTYIITGLVWTAFFELMITYKEERYLNHIERITHFILWPIWIIIFIIGWIIGFFKGMKNNNR